MIRMMSGRWMGDTLVRYNEMNGWNYSMMENKKGKGINCDIRCFYESILSHVNARMHLQLWTFKEPVRTPCW